MDNPPLVEYLPIGNGVLAHSWLLCGLLVSNDRGISIAMDTPVAIPVVTLLVSLRTTTWRNVLGSQTCTYYIISKFRLTHIITDLCVSETRNTFIQIHATHTRTNIPIYLCLICDKI